ncbi:ABC transporter substrate-binding protein [Zavarzinia sp. CC-PAN008]|uniref:ABC transporter substrate-binding protein n=1 Tax=Zavarzinia sp. CC-PAN008 TaxID=3243332 RepID=UPI003F746193
MRRPFLPVALVLNALAVILLLVLAGAAQARPQRIVSLNLCADPFLVALADREQIAALTHFARLPAMSTIVAEAEGLPATTGTAEEVLSLRPDLIIASPYRRKETRALLARYAIPTLEIAPAETFQAVIDQTRRIAEAIGQVERGEALVRSMTERVAALEAEPVGRGALALYYQRRGFVTGTDTLIDEMMGRVGLVNVAKGLGRRSIFRLGLEQVIQARPDLIIVNMDTSRVTDQGSALLVHPALDRIVPQHRRLFLPEALTVCGSPAYPDAVALLRQQVVQALR